MYGVNPTVSFFFFPLLLLFFLLFLLCHIFILTSDENMMEDENMDCNSFLFTQFLCQLPLVLLVFKSVSSWEQCRMSVIHLSVTVFGVTVSWVIFGAGEDEEDRGPPDAIRL